eukprot:2168362-Pyramimonas_sp.AAC.2
MSSRRSRRRSEEEREDDEAECRDGEAEGHVQGAPRMSGTTHGDAGGEVVQWLSHHGLWVR